MIRKHKETQKLQPDNVSPKQVVEIVKEYRRNDNMEFEYSTRYDFLAIKDHTDKIDNKTQGLEIIFGFTSNEKA